MLVIGGKWEQAGTGCVLMGSGRQPTSVHCLEKVVLPCLALSPSGGWLHCKGAQPCSGGPPRSPPWLLGAGDLTMWESIFTNISLNTHCAVGEYNDEKMTLRPARNSQSGMGMKERREVPCAHAHAHSHCCLTPPSPSLRSSDYLKILFNFNSDKIHII